MVGLNFCVLVFPTFLLWRKAESFVANPAFVSSVSTKSQRLYVSLKDNENDSSLEASRRDFFQDIAVKSIELGGLLSLAPEPALASGGATAGGAYLLSAKQRYNKRVTSGVKGFMALSAPLETGSLSEAKDFFAGEDEGTWKDLSTAGYLLANAFRTSSTTPPDRLPTVKNWKAFNAQITAMQKAVKKKESKGSLAAYMAAAEALDTYLESVELPPSIEMK